MRDISIGRICWTLLVAGFAAPIGQALAQDGFCGGAMVFGDANDIALATITDAAPRTHLVAGKTPARSGCPSAEAACRLKAYLVPGDQVLIAAGSGNFRCATFRSVKGSETSGFLPARALTETSPATPALADWTGKWVREHEATLTISTKDDGLAVKGDASWGAGDPERVRRGSVNVGEIDGSGRPKGNLLALGEDYDGSVPPSATERDECRVRLRLFGRYLAVDDNGGCGGANVSFTGVYTRR
jgi:hypothetical protein